MVTCMKFLGMNRIHRFPGNTMSWSLSTLVTSWILLRKLVMPFYKGTPCRCKGLDHVAQGWKKLVLFCVMPLECSTNWLSKEQLTGIHWMYMRVPLFNHNFLVVFADFYESEVIRDSLVSYCQPSLHKTSLPPWVTLTFWLIPYKSLHLCFIICDPTVNLMLFDLWLSPSVCAMYAHFLLLLHHSTSRPLLPGQTHSHQLT